MPLTDGGTGRNRQTGRPVLHRIRPTAGHCVMLPAPHGIPKDCLVLAEYQGFTEGELDFIINHYIKYDVGREG